MNDRKLIETEIGSPPAETPVSQQGLPEDILSECAAESAWTREDARHWPYRHPG